MGEAPQKAQGRFSGFLSFGVQFPLSDPLQPGQGAAPVKYRQSIGGALLLYQPRGLEVAVSPLIGALVGIRMGLDLRGRQLRRRQIVEAAQVHIPPHRRREPRLHHMGTGAVHHSAAQCRKHHTVQGVRVTGAPQILHRRSRPLHGPADLPHECIFAHARTAL